MAMLADLEGTVSSLALPADHGLWPVFEAIHNAIDAIDERRLAGESFSPWITVEVFREPKATGGEAPLITGVTIADNGVGFTEPNRKAFDFIHTRRKARLGGKGVGRLTWLKVFDKATITSFDGSGDGRRRRDFVFSLPEGVTGENVEPAPGADAEPGTVVALEGLKSDYRSGMYVRPETLARRVVEHFLTLFVLAKAAPIRFRDGDYEKSLRDVYEEIVAPASSSSTLDIEGEGFTVRHFMVRGYPNATHQIRWCARGRAVQDQSVTLDCTNVAGLGRRVVHDGGKFVYYTYVESDLLTRSVNQSRTRFSIPTKMWRAIEAAVLVEVDRYLKPHLTKRREEIDERITKFVQDAPQYRHIVRDHRGRLSRVTNDWSDRRLEVEMAKVRAEVEFDTRERARKILAQDQPSEEKLAEVTAGITEGHRADLAGYVAHRRIVLDLIRGALRKHDDDGKYPYEKHVHNVLFPMRRTSDDLPALRDHNLWVLDERLAFYSYISSDREFRRTPIKVMEDGDGRRPDLLALDRVSAFGLGDELELKGVTLVELKRGEGMETANDDPCERLTEYMALIRDGDWTRADGQQVPVGAHVPIYAFAVCKITRKFERKLQRHYRATLLADGSWFYNVPEDRFHVHVIPYRTAILNAEKRNAVFFDVAGLLASTRR